MSLYRSKKNYKIKLLLVISLLLISIFILFPKKNWKENLLQNIRIYTCQPNFTNVYDSQNFKIKRLFYGSLNFIKNGCKYDDLKLNISFKNFNLIKKDRQIAIDNGILTNPREVPAIIIYKNKKYRSDVRLKGDLSNHWYVNKQWSLKVELKDGKSINGMKEFSITKLIERNYPDNLILSNELIRHGLISPKFKIYKTNVNGQNWGLMIAEEQFSNVFLENRKLKDGLIFKLTNEAKFKLTRYLGRKNIKKRDFFLDKQDQLEVDIFNKKKINQNKFLRDQETLIRSIKEKLNFSDDDNEKTTLVKKYFNVSKLAHHLANVVVFDNFHSLAFSNIRFYLNPYNLVIEPIPTDNTYKLASKNTLDYVEKLEKLESTNIIYYVLFNDESFRDEYNNSLLKIKSNLKKIKNESHQLCKNFEDYCKKIIDFENIESHISNLIKLGDDIFPKSKSIKNQKNKIDFSKISTTNKELAALNIYNNYIYARLFRDYFKVYNNTLDEIYLRNLVLYFDNDLKKCKIFKKKNCEITKYDLSINLNNNPKTSYKKIQLNLNDKENLVWAEINGKIKKENFNYITRVENQKFDEDKLNKTELYNNKHLKNLKNKTFFINGKLFIKKPIIVPKNHNLNIASGSELIFSKNAYIYLNGGNLIIDGKDELIKLAPSDEYWRGIYVNNSPKLSKINNTKIISTNNFVHEGISLTGGLNFYNSDVEISDSVILNAKCEDAINIINSKFELNNSQIINSISDGLDADFSDGSINNSFFENIGGDAIDTSGSKISIINTEIYGAEDKGLSAGENSEIYVENFKIESSKFGLVSKDLSKVSGKKIKIINSIEFDVMAFEKKMHFGPGFIDISEIKSNDKILSQTNSIIVINNKKIASENFDSKEFY